jgi:hypothetical protein
MDKHAVIVMYDKYVRFCLSDDGKPEWSGSEPTSMHEHSVSKTVSYLETLMKSHGATSVEVICG